MAKNVGKTRFFLAFTLLTSCSLGTATVPLPFNAGGNSMNSPFQERSPHLSGRYLVFVSDRRGSQDVYVYDWIDRRLIDLPGLNAPNIMASQPAVSGDGRLVVFVGSRDRRSDIFLYDRQDQRLRNLTQGLRADTVQHPSLSANGEIIAFQASIRGQWDILVYSRFGQPLNFEVLPQ